VSNLQTSRDLYAAVAGLIERRQACPRSLEQYLGTLWDLARAYRARPELSLNEFFQVLSDAFDRPAPEFDEAWRARHEKDFAHLPGFVGWEACVLRQIVDLHEMAEHGMIDDEQRYFGVDSPRGQRWYNFDPCTFLECAAAGSYGGRDPGDDGRLEESGAGDLAAACAVIRSVPWEDFRSFLGAGQWYE
jgi:hypothetical protein